MNLLEKAKSFHSLGANVLPIIEEKKPLIEWTSLMEKRQSLEELQSYNWNSCKGIGIVCGPGGYVCIDVDKINNPAAINTILREMNLTDTYQWQVKSGSGIGRHIWVRVSRSLPFTKGAIFGDSKDGSFDHIEIRWKNCQTLVPPSLHISGNPYSWLYGEPATEPQEVSVEAIIAAFEAVATLRVEDPKKDKPKYRKTNYTEILANGVSEGQRNDTVASMTGHFRKRGLEYSETLELLKIWNGRLTQPLDEKELETTVTSIFSMPSSNMIIRDGIEMSLMSTPVLNDIVEGIIGENSFNFLAGEEGAGKSLLSMNLGLAIATGLPKFLDYPIKKHGTVLYLNNELPFSVFVGRFKKMRTKFYREQSSQLNNFITPEFIKPLKESWDDIVKIVKQREPVLVILDCFYWAHDSKENDSSEMKEIMRQLIALRDQYGVAVLVVHHTKKGTRFETMHNDNMRGSMVFSASSDTVMMLRRSSKDEGKRLFKPTKLRNGTDELRRARLLDLGPGDLWFSDIGEANEDEHLPMQGESRKTSANDDINFSKIFGTDQELSRQVIIDRCKESGFSSRTVDRCLKKQLNDDDGMLQQPRFGFYSMKPKDGDSLIPIAQAA